MCLIHIPEPVGSERDLDTCSLFFKNHLFVKMFKRIIADYCFNYLLDKNKEDSIQKAEAQDVKVSVSRFLGKTVKSRFSQSTLGYQNDDSD